jgi:hypothetical protein
VLRLTVQFADGRSMSILDEPTGEAPDPDRPMISSGPGTGGGVDGWSFDMEYRVRPSPARAAGLHLRVAGTRDPDLAGGG